VDTTESGREGLDRAAARHFDLVITDLKMPDLDGMELVRTLRQKRPDTAIVIITGYGTVPSAVEAVRLGVSDYIEKPFTPRELTDAVSRACSVAEPEAKLEIEADLVKDVLRRASREPSFGSRLLTEGSRVLSGVALSSEAKAAIVSGDIAWIEKQCGELSAEERDWLERRLQAEIW
jgi:YesN/AraC family two-component response regulator